MAARQSHKVLRKELLLEEDRSPNASGPAFLAPSAFPTPLFLLTLVLSLLSSCPFPIYRTNPELSAVVETINPVRAHLPPFTPSSLKLGEAFKCVPLQLDHCMLPLPMYHRAHLSTLKIHSWLPPLSGQSPNSLALLRSPMICPIHLSKLPSVHCLCPSQSTWLTIGSSLKCHMSFACVPLSLASFSASPLSLP